MPGQRTAIIAAFLMLGEGCTVTTVELETTDHDVIQTQLDEARAGSTIVLPAGTVGGTLIIPLAITLRGATDGATIIDPGGRGPAIAIDASAGETRLERLTLRGGRTKMGGGVSAANGGDVTISHCVITGNTAVVGLGGGVCLDRGRLTIEESRIEANDANLGGGIYVGGTGRLAITNTIIVENSADRGAGLAVVDGARAKLDDVELKENVARVHGHALVVFGSSSRQPEVELDRVSIMSSAEGSAIVNEQPNPGTIRAERTDIPESSRGQPGLIVD